MIMTIAANPNVFGLLPTTNALTSVYLSAAATTAVTYGTSLGLDRSLWSILMDCKSQLDPSGTVLSSWTSNGNPCLASGTTWLGITCANVYSGRGAARVVQGGAATVALGGRNLQGQLCLQMRELRTITSFDISNNPMSGSIPSQWRARARVAPHATCHSAP